MGNGLRPGPIGGSGGTAPIDEGTLTRAQSPWPGPLGLSVKSSAPKNSAPSLADRILAFARRRQGQRVADGECFALADSALTNAGGKTAGDFGPITPDADYVWGTAVSLGDVQPGDVVQFRGYRYERRVEVNNPDGSGSFRTEVHERPHHTAIVERVDGNGALTVLEQNSPAGSPVTRTQLFFSSRSSQRGRETTTITVQGTVWFYRPAAR